MIKANESLEKFLTIEKAVNEMVNLHQEILEMRGSVARQQEFLNELRMNENKHRILLENLPQEVFMKDKDLVYTLCSQSYAAELKRKPEEIIGKTDEDFYPEEAATRYRSDDKRVMTTGQADDAEESFVREGKSFVVHRIKIPLKDNKGEIVGILGVSWDITEQRQKEDGLRRKLEKLEESLANLTTELQRKDKLLEGEIAERSRMEKRLQMAEGISGLFDRMAIPVVLVDENRVISLANAEFEKLSGYSKEEVESKKSLMDFFSQEDSERLAEYFETHGENPDFVIGDTGCQLLNKSGKILDISLSLSIISGTNKSVACLLDMTERKRTEERMAELEELYTSLIQNANEGIALVQNGILKFVNPKVMEILGHPKEELTCKPFREFILPEDRERFEVEPDKPTDGDFKNLSFLRMVQQDGTVRWLEDRVTLVRWGKERALLHILTDKTHQKKAEEELRMSIEPFQRLAETLEKYFSASNGKKRPLEPPLDPHNKYSRP